MYRPTANSFDSDQPAYKPADLDHNFLILSFPFMEQYLKPICRDMSGEIGYRLSENILQGQNLISLIPSIRIIFNRETKLKIC